MEDWAGHIATCPDCRAQATIHAELARVLPRIPEPRLSSHFEGRLGHRLREMRESVPRRQRAVFSLWQTPAQPPGPLRRWVMRIYWMGAWAAVASILGATTRLEHAQVEGLAVAGLLILIGLQRLLRPWRLSRVMGAAMCAR